MKFESDGSICDVLLAASISCPREMLSSILLCECWATWWMSQFCISPIRLEYECFSNTPTETTLSRQECQAKGEC